MLEKSLKVLAIGNSFSLDAMEYLWDLAHNDGYKSIILGDLYIPGCSLETHWKNAQDNLPHYQYYKNTKGKWNITDHKTLNDALKEENWDVITMQQSSGRSGLISTYQPFLQKLVDYVKQTSPQSKLVWHMTWAYQNTHTNPAFGEYQFNQLIMYQKIVDTVSQLILANPNFDYVIPCGTAIQNVRTSYIGDHLTRDGYHLTPGLGRYTAGLMWLSSLSNHSIEHINFVPVGLTTEEVIIAKKAVDLAFLNPFQIKQL